MTRHVLLAVSLLLGLVAATAHANGTGVREVSASGHSLITLTTKVRFTTMILLPDDEEILDIVCGDKDFWVISAAQNIAHVKPAKDGATTNLNLVTTSGTVYSFLLTENKQAQTDLKVYVTVDSAQPRGRPKYYTSAQVETLQTELTQARAATDAERRRADEAIAAFRQQYPRTLQFTYLAAKDEKPFHVRAIWHDGQFTYIRSAARELPALYELKDGRPSLVNFQVHDGTYVVPKVLDEAYLALGKARLAFRQER